MQYEVDANIALMKAMDFDSVDVGANRMGFLTEEQRENLTGERWYWRLWSIITLVAVPLFIAMTIADGIHRHDTVASRVGMIALILILAGVLYAYTHSKWKRVHTDILEGRVLSVVGTVKLKKHRENNGTKYEVMVEKMKFSVMRRVSEAFQQGEIYRIYYAPHSKIALSAELLPKSEMNG
jgi:hypothetical protein